MLLLGIGPQASADEPLDSKDVNNVTEQALPIEALQSFVAVYERIRLNHVDAKTDEQLIQLALEGMILKLDRFSSYLDVKDMARLEEDTKGEYSGIGVELVPEGNYIRVITPIDDSPAFKAGIKAGDWITHVDSKSIKGLDLQSISQLMAGTVGTQVVVSMLRDGQQFELTLTREIINAQSVRSKLMPNDVGYLRVSQFQDQTGQDLVDQMLALTKAGAKSWVLDLRNNPGGTLSAAAKVADAFLTKGLIVTTKARQADDNLAFNATSNDPSQKQPLAVLINNGSASASEIVAGAMKDQKRATILGTTSFGKGSVQSVITLPNGDGVKLTTAYYFTPNGHNIHQQGIEPDIRLEDSNADEDLVLAAALKHLNTKGTHQ